VTLRPPSSLNAAERATFIDIVGACDPNHFRPSDMPLLCRYAEEIVLAERAARELRKNAVIGNKISPWLTVQEKAIRAIVSLSMRLRLSPQARQPTHPGTPRPPLSVYDRMAMEHDDD
jgi:hypothetical protein